MAVTLEVKTARGRVTEHVLASLLRRGSIALRET
jgi:hypothetical protein